MFPGPRYDCGHAADLYTVHCKSDMSGWGEGSLVTYFPTFVPEFKYDKTPNSHYPIVQGGGGGGFVDILSNFCS